jgi:hypothetical protein
VLTTLLLVLRLLGLGRAKLFKYRPAKAYTFISLAIQNYLLNNKYIARYLFIIFGGSLNKILEVFGYNGEKIFVTLKKLDCINIKPNYFNYLFLYFFSFIFLSLYIFTVIGEINIFILDPIA